MSGRAGEVTRNRPDPARRRAPDAAARRRPAAARWWTAGLVALPVAALSVLGYGRRWICDDGLIYLRPVRQVLAGHGPVFNAGERAESSTGAIWQWLLTLAAWLTHADPAFLAVGMGLLLSTTGYALALWGTCRAYAASAVYRASAPPGPDSRRTNADATNPGSGRPRRASRRPDAAPGSPRSRTGRAAPDSGRRERPAGRRRRRAGRPRTRMPAPVLLPAGILALLAAPPVWSYMTSGLESGLGTFWTGLAWWLLVRTRRGQRRWAQTATAFVFGLGWLVRPDLAVVTVCFLTAQWWVLRLRSTRTAGLLSAAGLVPAAYEVFRAGYYGVLLPLPAIAKEAGASDWGRGARYVQETLGPYWLWPALGVLTVVAGHLLLGARRGRGPGGGWVGAAGGRAAGGRAAPRRRAWTAGARRSVRDLGGQDDGRTRGRRAARRAPDEDGDREGRGRGSDRYGGEAAGDPGGGVSDDGAERQRGWGRDEDSGTEGDGGNRGTEEDGAEDTTEWRAYAAIESGAVPGRRAWVVAGHGPGTDRGAGPGGVRRSWFRRRDRAADRPWTSGVRTRPSPPDATPLAVFLAPPAAGLLLALYVVRMGGDYMHARMILPALLLLLLPVLVVPATRWTAAAGGLLLVWVAAAVSPLRQPFDLNASHGTFNVRSSDVRYTHDHNPVRTATWVRHWPRLPHANEMLAAAVRGRQPAMLYFDDRRQLHTIPMRSDTPYQVVMVGRHLGVTGAAVPLDDYVNDAWGLASPIGAHLALERWAWPGHEKFLRNEWIFADWAVDSPPAADLRRAGVQQDHMVAARKALGCGPLAELTESVRAPLTRERFWQNLTGAWDRTRFRFARSPERAAADLCGGGGLSGAGAVRGSERWGV